MAKIDVSQITPLVQKRIGKTIFELVEQFYQEPENVRKFEEWKAAQNATQKERRGKSGGKYGK